MKTYVSRALYGALFVGGLSVLGATAAQAADTTGEDGLLSGSQVVSDITAPIAAQGNAVSILGDATSAAPAASAPAAIAQSTNLLSSGSAITCPNRK